MQHPLALWPLVFFLLFLALGGLYGGIAIQYITAVDGLLIMLFVLLPGVRKFYAEM